MIAPRKPLIFLALALGVPLATLAFLPHAAATAARLMLTAALLAAAVDALLARRLSHGLSAESSGITRMVQDRPSDFALVLTSPAGRALHAAAALAPPSSMAFDPPETTVRIPKDQTRSTLQFACTARRRGRFLLRRIHVAIRSPLGLWGLQRSLPLEGEIRVYPNLRDDRRALAALFLRRGPLGIHTRPQIGKGREFEHLRDYMPGDTYQDIHWKTTAKRNHPVAKAYQVERTQEVYAIIDASRLSARRITTDPDSPPQIEKLVTAAMVLGMAAERQGDKFGLAVFSDRVDRFLPAGAGPTHFSACRETLYTLEPRPVNPDYETLFTFIRLRLRRRALLVVLTHLDDPALADDFERSLRIAARRYLILAMMVQPPGIAPILAGKSPTHLSALYDQLAGHYQWLALAERERSLHRLGASFMLAPHETLSTEMVKSYLNIKRRQIL